jgi:hypothetical protein
MIKSIAPNPNSLIQDRKIDFSSKEQDDVKQTSLEFSKMFLKSAFKEMFNESQDSSYFGDSYGGQMWKSLYVEKIAELCAGRTGIEQMIEKSVAKKVNPYEQQAENKNEMEAIHA